MSHLYKSLVHRIYTNTDKKIIVHLRSHFFYSYNSNLGTCVKVIRVYFIEIISQLKIMVNLFVDPCMR